MAVKHSLYHETGKLSVDMERCTLCGVCVKNCPVEVLQIEDDAVRQIYAGFGCVACGHCMMVCPEACITVTGRNLFAEDLQPLPPQDARADAERHADLIEKVPMRRFGKPAEVAAVIQFLLSDAASYMTGQVLYVDGGLTSSM